ncbi:TorF family putative porin [Salinisphaera sp. SPP-AMP-43]|uniref:TorF family putative porin n=1 Tax=Salinisphaera sp. SPP-AMP-43 TaxID=3121288 RepID=UPI003C6E4FDC
MTRLLFNAIAASALTASSVTAIAADSSTASDWDLKAFKGSLTANVAFTTDYRFRGISQTDRDFAVQGGFDYAMDSGFYLGTWASNVDNFNPNPYNGDNGAQAEVDLYGGYGTALSDQLSFDFNVLYYYYPGASTAGPNPEIDFWEFTPSVTYAEDNLSATLGLSYSGDYYGESGDSFYPKFGFSSQLNNWLTFGGHVGYQVVDDNDAWGTPDYLDWSLSLATDQFGLNWKVAYIDTDLSGGDCFGGANTCGATVVGTISKSF